METSIDFGIYSSEFYNKYFEGSEEYDYINYYWKSHKSTIKFIIHLFCETTNAARVNLLFNPRPKYYKQEDINTEDIKETFGMKLKKSIIISYLEKAIDKDAKTDREIFIDKPSFYITLHFYLNNLNKYFFKYSNLIDVKRSKKIEQIYEVEDQISQFDNRFNDDENDYLFHGSSIENWLSILNNGLYVGTNENKLLINGAVHGTGIYLSDNIGLSLSYSNRYGSYSGSIIIVGVFQVMKKKDEYKKTTQIYVVPNREEVKLRYLLLMNTKSTEQKFIDKLNAKFSREVKKTIKMTNIAIDNVSAKRIMAESRIIMRHKQAGKIEEEYGIKFDVNIDDEDITKWTVKFYIENFKESNYKLYEEMIDKDIEYIEMEVLLKINGPYPVNPPFVRIVYPHFQFMTGHITTGGSICMDLLTQKEWVKTCRITGVLVAINVQCFGVQRKHDKTCECSDKYSCDECYIGARLDQNNWRKSYGLEEAIEAYKRMLRAHAGGKW